MMTYLQTGDLTAADSGAVTRCRPYAHSDADGFPALGRGRFAFRPDFPVTARRPVGTGRAAAYKWRMPTTEPSKDPLLALVGQRIQDLREAKRIEPKDFAKAAGFSLSYLWRLEGGQQNITLATISRIAIALGEPMSALLAGIEPDPATLAARPYVRRPEKAAPKKAGTRKTAA